jgi:hypothetical protein
VTPFLPAWLQLAWAIAGLTIATGGIVWTLAILWPYMRVTREAILESLKIARESRGDFAELVREARELVKAAKESGISRERVEKLVSGLEKIPEKLDQLAQKNLLKSI